MICKYYTIVLLILFSAVNALAQNTFPYVMPEKKPLFKLSLAMDRVYDNYEALTPQANELFTNFKYSMLSGFDYNNGNGTISRRDASRIIKVNGKYYMWYTKRNTEVPPMGPDRADDESPSVDWDLCDIAYATSNDGFHWEEQGIAVKRPKKPNIGWRSVSTPDILVWNGKYYLYYQAFNDMSGKGLYDCAVSMSYSESPDGPWIPINKTIISNGKDGEWDQYAIHDPQPIVYKGKIYLYYKGDYNKKQKYGTIRSQGLAISDSPFGPFKKYERNPVISSGHETQLFRFKEGIASIMASDGHKNNTIQYASDGINFKIGSICSMMPRAAGLYDPDAFTDVKYAKGITWGISHYLVPSKDKKHTILLRFDCDLSTEVDIPEMKRNDVPFTLEELLSRGLNKKLKNDVLNRCTIK